MLDDSTVEILIDVRDRGRQNFTEAQAAMDLLRRAVEKFSQAQVDGMSTAFAYREALKALRNAALEAGVGQEALKVSTNQARDAFAAYMTVIASGLPVQAALSAALSVDTVEENRNTEAVQDNRHAYELILPTLGLVATAYGTVGLAALKGLNPFAGWLNLLAFSAVALGPFIASMTAATVIVTAFSTALIGMIAATSGAALMFAGIAAAAFMLADATGKLDITVGAHARGGASTALQQHLADAQRALNNFNALHTGGLTLAQQQQQQNLALRESRAQAAVDAANAGAGVMTGGQSVNQLAQNFKDLAAVIGERAVPAARELIGWINGGFATIRNLADGILSWFSDRLPLVLSRMGTMLRDLLPNFKDFAKFMGDAFDHVSPQIGPMFELLTRFALGFGEGLISNLMALSDWFQQRLPSYGPVVSQIFSGIGNAVQGLASNFGKLSDWFVKNWPSIKGNLDAFTSGFSEGFKKLNLTFGGAGSVDWKGFFHDLGGLIGGITAVISDFARVVGILFSQVVAAMPAALKTIGDNWATFVHGAIEDINDLIQAFDNLPGFLRGGASIPLITNITPPGAATQGGGPSSGRGGNGPAGGATSRSGGNKITINVNGSGSPQVTARTIARNLGRLGVA